MSVELPLFGTETQIKSRLSCKCPCGAPVWVIHAILSGCYGQRGATGTAAAKIIAEEEQMYARVQARVAAGDQASRPLIGASDMDRELIELRDAIAEAKPEDLPPLVEQMTRLSAIRAKLGGGRSLPVDVASPYFAHMTLREGDKQRDVLIGKRGFIDRESNVQIVDWRNAPISQIYYRYHEGDDYAEEIAGRTLEGVVLVRRNISIAGGKLRRIGTPDGTFVRDARNVWHEAIGEAAPTLRGGQGKASRAPVPRPRTKRDRGKLGVHHGAMHRADKHMPEIAALIDRDQFELVTQPDSGILVIQGGAGSGKTTVALHRIAYLNFADRSRFRPKSILFVVPSSALVRYVADVLPSLGVTGVPVVTYASWAQTQRRKMLPNTSTKYNDNTPDTVSRLKKHPALLGIASEYVAEQSKNAYAEIEAFAQATAGGDKLIELWQHGASLAVVPRLRQLYRWLKSDQPGLSTTARNAGRALVDRLGRRCADIIADWAELLTDVGRLTSGFAGSDVTSGQIKQLVAWVTSQYDGADMAKRGTKADYRTVDGRELDDSSITGRFDEEDDPLLLRLLQLKRGGLTTRDGHSTTYNHIAVDEAQDRSAIEVKVLLETTPAQGGDPAARSVTIAGDTAQRLVFDNGFVDWGDLLERTGFPAAVHELHLSYRSTAEVMDLAREILGPELAPKKELIARSGAPVELHEFGDIGESVAFLSDALRTLAAREPTASIAVVSRYSEQADAYYDGFRRAEIPRLRRVRAHDFSFSPGVDVTDVSQVKGLEFDYVIMVDVNESSYPATVESRHLLHIGATRAAHQLWLISTATVSPLLPEALRRFE